MLRRHFLAPQERIILETHPSKWWYFFAVAVAAPFLWFADYVLLTRVYPPLPQVPTLSSWLQNLPASNIVPWALVLGTVAIFLAFVWIGWALWEAYLWAAQTYAVTDERIVQQTGIVRHNIQEIPLRQIRDVEVFQPRLAARLLRYGTLRFKSLSEADPPADPSKPRVRDEFERNLDPRTPRARGSGVEWWIGVPNPFRIERTVQTETRATVPPATPAAAYP